MLQGKSLTLLRIVNMKATLCMGFQVGWGSGRGTVGSPAAWGSGRPLTKNSTRTRVSFERPLLVTISDIPNESNNVCSFRGPSSRHLYLCIITLPLYLFMGTTKF